MNSMYANKDKESVRTKVMENQTAACNLKMHCNHMHHI